MKERKCIFPGIHSNILIGAIIFLLIVAFSCAGCGDDNSEDSSWPTTEIAKVVPEPTAGDVSISFNDEEQFYYSIDDLSEEEAEEYLKACKDKGFTIDADNTAGYKAYNEDGYKINIYVTVIDSSVDLNVQVDAPIEMTEIDWEDIDAFKLLPKPKSTEGHIEWENSDSALVYLGNTSPDDFKDYIKACKKAGFRKDYRKGDDYYYADHKRKNKNISLNYEGFNIMRIKISKPSDDDSDDEDIDDDDADNDTSAKKENKEKEDKSSKSEKKSSSNDSSADFRKTMDDYEKFMNKYVKFMKKYNNSDNVTEMLDDYADLVDDYSDWSDKIDDIDTDELSTADYNYYTKVVNRVNKKLAGLL